MDALSCAGTLHCTAAPKECSMHPTSGPCSCSSTSLQLPGWSSSSSYPTLAVVWIMQCPW